MHDIDCLSGRRDLRYSVGNDLPPKGSRQGALCRVIVCCCFLTYHCERQPILLLSRGSKTHSSETRHTTLQATDRTEMGQPTCQALPTSPPRRTSPCVLANLYQQIRTGGFSSRKQRMRTIRSLTFDQGAQKAQTEALFCQIYATRNSIWRFCKDRAPRTVIGPKL